MVSPEKSGDDINRPEKEKGGGRSPLEEELLRLMSQGTAGEQAKPEAEKGKTDSLQQELLSPVGSVAPEETKKKEEGMVPPGTGAAPAPPEPVAGFPQSPEVTQAEPSPLQQELSSIVGKVVEEKEPASAKGEAAEAGVTEAQPGMAEPALAPKVALRKPGKEAKRGVNFLSRLQYGAALYFSRLLRSQQRVISLSVEGTSLRFLSVLGNRVETWGSVPLNRSLLRNGYVADPEGVGQVIRAALGEKKISRGRVICAFPGLGAVSRVITLPQAARANLSKVVPREAKRLMTLSLETNYLVWRPLHGKEVELKVFVLAVPKEPLLTWARAIQAAGLRPQAIDLKPLALARAVNRKDAIVVNAEANCLELIIVVNDFPTLMRSVFLGEEGLTAEQVTSRLAEELERTISFYGTANRGNPLGPEVAIYLSGELATPALAGQVATVTGRPVAPLEPPVLCPPDFPLASFTVNLGLALKARK